MPEYPPSLNLGTIESFLDKHIVSLIHLDAKWDAMGFQLQRRIQELAKSLDDSVGFGFIDVDEYQDEAIALGVLNVPSCAYYRGREHLKTVIGLNQDIETNLDMILRGDKPDWNARVKLD